MVWCGNFWNGNKIFFLMSIVKIFIVAPRLRGHAINIMDCPDRGAAYGDYTRILSSIFNNWRIVSWPGRASSNSADNKAGWCRTRVVHYIRAALRTVYVQETRGADLVTPWNPQFQVSTHGLTVWMLNHTVNRNCWNSHWNSVQVQITFSIFLV